MRVVATFTDRSGGGSAPPYDTNNLALHVGDDPAVVAANRAQLSAGPVVWMDQVHGARVEVVDGPLDGAVPGTDALVTATPGLTLAVLVADCVPVLLADGEAGVVAAVHAGRRGVQAGIAARALAAMQHLGARPDRTTAALGPAVCGSCYEVPAAMQEEVAADLPAARATTRTGTPGLDLRAGLRAQLDALGVARVEVSAVCTAESPDHYSYRRDGVTGRFAGLVRLEP